jgi:hypothetical protein
VSAVTTRLPQILADHGRLTTRGTVHGSDALAPPSDDEQEPRSRPLLLEESDTPWPVARFGHRMTRQASASPGIYAQAPLMSDLVDRIRAELDARIRELRPMVRELERLEHAAAELARAGARSVPGLRSRVAAPRAKRAATRKGEAEPSTASQSQEGWRRSAARPRRGAKPAPRCSRRLLQRQAAVRRRWPTRLRSRRASPRQPSQGWSSRAACAVSTRADTP